MTRNTGVQDLEEGRGCWLGFQAREEREQTCDLVEKSGEPHFRELDPAGRLAATVERLSRSVNTFPAGDTTSGIIASMAWTVETLNETVDAELAELPADMRARLSGSRN
jgi:hypothetical protein